MISDRKHCQKQIYPFDHLSVCMSIDVLEKSPSTAKNNSVWPYIDPFTHDTIVSVCPSVRPFVGSSIIQFFRLAKIVFEHFHQEIKMLPEAGYLFTDSLTPTGEYASIKQIRLSTSDTITLSSLRCCCCCCCCCCCQCCCCLCCCFCCCCCCCW